MLLPPGGIRVSHFVSQNHSTCLAHAAEAQSGLQSGGPGPGTRTNSIFTRAEVDVPPAGGDIYTPWTRSEVKNVPEYCLVNT